MSWSRAENRYNPRSRSPAPSVGARDALNDRVWVDCYHASRHAHSMHSLSFAPVTGAGCPGGAPPDSLSNAPRAGLDLQDHG
jgi:hypothetical protein